MYVKNNRMVKVRPKDKLIRPKTRSKVEARAWIGARFMKTTNKQEKTTATKHSPYQVVQYRNFNMRALLQRDKIKKRQCEATQRLERGESHSPL